MEKKNQDVIALLAADLTSPRVVAAIDEALQLNEQVRNDLLDLRKVAVRLHGGPPAQVAVTPGAADPAVEATIPSRIQGPSTQQETFASLVDKYRTSPKAAYAKLRHSTRRAYDGLIKRLLEDFGTQPLVSIKGPNIQAQYERWSEGGKFAMGHALITMLRGVIHFGESVLGDSECERLSVALHNMQFKVTQGRSERITAEQATALRTMARRMGFNSIALAQALQFECGLRQKDVIGEWVPISEPGVDGLIVDDEKWVRGIRWEQIDGAWVLRHQPSNGGKMLELDLSKYQMVREEFQGLDVAKLSGPMMISERTGLPWRGHEFRRSWRKIADACGIPKTVFNMDSRLV